jgi:hypothetical protein
MTATGTQGGNSSFVIGSGIADFIFGKQWMPEAWFYECHFISVVSLIVISCQLLIAKVFSSDPTDH